MGAALLSGVSGGNQWVGLSRAASFWAGSLACMPEASLSKCSLFAASGFSVSHETI